MSLFQRLFGRKPAAGRPEVPLAAPDRKRGEQSVLVHLDCAGLPDHVYEECDLATIEERLVDVLEREGLGELDGNEMGPDEATLFLYGPDAERLFAGIEATLRAYPLCAGARVVVRSGAPGAPEREIRLGA